MASKYSYQMTERAIADLDDYLSHTIGTLSNPDAAASFMDELEEKLDDLCKNPKIGSIISNPFIYDNSFRKILAKNFIVYYFTNEEEHEIAILRIVYSGRDQDKIIIDIHKLF